MHVARLTQEYYGFIGGSTLPDKQVGINRAEQQRPPPKVLPAERLVEGELLKNRRGKGAAGNSLNDLLQRGRFSAGDSKESDISAQAAQRAINAYLNNVALTNSPGYRPSPTVDYYA